MGAVYDADCFALRCFALSDGEIRTTAQVTAIESPRMSAMYAASARMLRTSSTPGLG